MPSAREQRKEWELDRAMDEAHRQHLAARPDEWLRSSCKYFDGVPVRRKTTDRPEIPPGTVAEAKDNLERALALPAAQQPILRAASLDKLAAKLSENMDAVVDVKALLAEFPDLEPELVVEIAKVYGERQGRAMATSEKLVSSLLRASAKQAPSSQVNVQINTGDLDIPDDPLRDRRRR